VCNGEINEEKVNYPDLEQGRDKHTWGHSFVAK